MIAVACCEVDEGKDFVSTLVLRVRPSSEDEACQPYPPLQLSLRFLRNEQSVR